MNTEETRIYYFSGTGNGLMAAKQLGEELGAQIFPVTRELAEEKPLIECGKCILIFPAYAYGPPPLVRTFLKSADFKCGYFAAIATCGTTSGGALAAVKKLLAKKGQKLHYAIKVQSVENYIHFFGFPKDDIVTVRTDSQRTKVKIAAEMIKMNATNKIRSFRPFSRAFSIAFTVASAHLFCPRYRVLDTCTGCGFCASICPSAAITMRDGKPVFAAKKCDHCQSCLSLCPSKALRFWKIKPGSPRYVHPEAKADEFIKR